MCQLKDIEKMGTITRIDESLEGMRTLLKSMYRAALRARTFFSPASAGVSLPANPEKREIGPEDRVRVRSKKEIRSLLDEEGKYGGCRFMRGMYEHCGNSYRVLKDVDFFFDEARQKMVKTKGLVILEGANCSGQQRFYFNRCDRNCFFFWHKAWLEKIP